MIRAIAIDDELPALKVIENFCRKVDFITLERSFNKTAEALAYLERSPVDLLFLDIRMPAISGIDFYRPLQDTTQVIFTTAYSEYAVEGFNLKAMDYLLKPFTFERFLQAVNKVAEYRQLMDQSPQYLFVRVDYSLVKIDTADILFIEGLDDYLKIRLHAQKPIVVRMTMKNILEKLPPKAFIRVHRSYIVPFSRIEQVKNKVITIAGETIPIGSSYEAPFFAIFKS
ncbi:LytR/AlgR family response regulator transcription factor [Chitinophaga cymbidii]|uniref:DNA-binding response regulator n=1 Tax=Chitinophaga cymbidii TaxID=1096750 RepID=A0A512RQJ8_9BACT|nr:LytTR family DNA-binding domain-containing protein [Chitinophaga cymbidii]GEP97971.1 DNA-binding response regulator [Chitinophaga cymbidii]